MYLRMDYIVSFIIVSVNNLLLFSQLVHICSVISVYIYHFVLVVFSFHLYV